MGFCLYFQVSLRPAGSQSGSRRPNASCSDSSKGLDFRGSEHYGVGITDAPPLKALRGEAGLSILTGSAVIIPVWPVIGNLLTVGESRQMIAVVEKIRTALLH